MTVSRELLALGEQVGARLKARGETVGVAESAAGGLISAALLGVAVSEIRHMGSSGWAPGVDPEHHDYASFADFADPDGNTWVLQEVRRAKAAP